MALLEFDDAVVIIRNLAVKHNITGNLDWLRFIKTPAFKPYLDLLPKEPWMYYSESEVKKREAKKNSKTKDGL